MSKKKKQKNGQPIKPKNRSQEAIRRGLLRKLRRILKSNGRVAAADWLWKNRSKTIGRGVKKVEVILPTASWKKELSL